MEITPNSLGIDPEDVIYWGLKLDDALPLTEQTGALKEDLAQIHCVQGLLLDIGWHPSFCADGFFRVALVKTNNWDEPLYDQDAACLKTLRRAVHEALDVAR